MEGAEGDEVLVSLRNRRGKVSCGGRGGSAEVEEENGGARTNKRERKSWTSATLLGPPMLRRTTAVPRPSVEGFVELVVAGELAVAVARERRAVCRKNAGGRVLRTAALLFERDAIVRAEMRGLCGAAMANYLLYVGRGGGGYGGDSK